MNGDLVWVLEEYFSSEYGDEDHKDLIGVYVSPEALAEAYTKCTKNNSTDESCGCMYYCAHLFEIGQDNEIWYTSVYDKETFLKEANEYLSGGTIFRELVDVLINGSVPRKDLWDHTSTDLPDGSTFTDCKIRFRMYTIELCEHNGVYTSMMISDIYGSRLTIIGTGYNTTEDELVLYILDNDRKIKTVNIKETGITEIEIPKTKEE